MASDVPFTQPPPLFVLLCGGGGPRGAAALASLPKPLHLARGTPVVQLVLESIPAEEVLVVASQALEDVNFQSTLPHLAKGKRLRFATLQRATRGPVETAYLGLMSALSGDADRYLDSNDVRRPVVFFDNDTVYDIGSSVMPWGAHFIGTTLAPDATEIAPYCYVRLAPGDVDVIEVAEKRKISAHYASGVYGFASVSDFMLVARAVLLGTSASSSGGSGGGGSGSGGSGSVGRSAPPVVSDFFMSACFDRLLRDGSRVAALPMASPICLGTASDIAKNASRLPFRPLRLCFDVDNTVLQYKDVEGSYRDCKPVARMVQLIRKLKGEGHTIVLYTARGMATAKSNLGQLQATVGRDTFENLAQIGVPFDEIYFGKPHADVYVDDKGMNPFLSLFDALGFPGLELEVARELQLERGEAQSNRFNSIVRLGTTVHKEGPIGSMMGEEFFYRVTSSLPIAGLFPSFLGSSSGPHSITLRLEYVDGSTLFELLRDGLFTNAHLRSVMEALDAMHSCVAIPVATPKEAVFENYATKLASRIGDKSRYPFEDTGAIVARLGSAVREYIDSPRFRMAPVVHGDPWFSNTMLAGVGRIVFLDMKGDLAGRLTTNGDPLTDFGKLYQSLLGFDSLVLGMPPINAAMLAALRETFLSEVRQRGFAEADLRIVTACLIAKTLHFLEVTPEVRAAVWAIVQSLEK
jgi:capsule biosynthesis phosphatase